MLQHQLHALFFQTLWANEYFDSGIRSGLLGSMLHRVPRLGSEFL